jgi:hypothetical protein
MVKRVMVKQEKMLTVETKVLQWWKLKLSNLSIGHAPTSKALLNVQLYYSTVSPVTGISVIYLLYAYTQYLLFIYNMTLTF